IDTSPSLQVERPGPGWSYRMTRSSPAATRGVSRSATSSQAACASVQPWARTSVTGACSEPSTVACSRAPSVVRTAATRRHTVAVTPLPPESEGEVGPQGGVVPVLVEVPTGAPAGQPHGALRLRGDEVAVGQLRLLR